MAEEVFVDAIGRIDLSGGMVRLELLRVEPDQSDGPGKVIAAGRLVMPIQALLDAMGPMTRLAERLTAPSAPTQPRSPNFG